ncbi:MAG: 30S ribosomal protein S8 [Candidatus Cloacimonadales bacterium]|jgi:small subunit ribosomal protein S8|nr:30S ribosomal protein S8 [Candidatus Cloacimonadota bacterium]MDD3501285.1 30S ribosomal protein S8 [Candidatus Cloacimonadota bacterium]MDX9977381.1 30S ribosomal protein S8 [Candidatus Cloacimonadales bacterium]
MSISDPIADALTKVRNAYRAGHKQVTVHHCKLVESVLKILAKENFINNFDIIERDTERKIFRKQILVNLRYTNDGKPILRGIERISKPGRRVYVKAANIPSVYNNTGCAIISTSQGVLADRDARAQKAGGEYVCKVW